MQRRICWAIFQSTPPSREATRMSLFSARTPSNFNPRLPRGRRQRRMPLHLAKIGISIHASLAGGDLTAYLNFIDTNISIHASLAGGDRRGRGHTRPRPYFNPRLPRGRRLDIYGDEFAGNQFQSTPPSREATFFSAQVADQTHISIHASLAGGDVALRNK